MTEQSKLIIGEIDPTSVCGNNCGHCGDSSTMKGSVLPLEDIDRLLGSSLFDLSIKGGLCEETLPHMLDLGYRINDLKTIHLAGGGDPTFYLDGAYNFVDLVAVLSKYAATITLLTGGLNPDLTAEDLIRARENMKKWCKEPRIEGTVSHHPYGSPGHDERIKRTLEIFAAARIRELTISLRVLDSKIVAKMPAEMRAAFPFLTYDEFKKTELYVWIMERFKDEGAVLANFYMEISRTGGPHKMALDARPWISLVPERLLREAGRATRLPHGMCNFYCERIVVTAEIIEQMMQKMIKEGLSTQLRVTPDGFITGCESSKFQNPEQYEGDLYGHSYEEILSNRILFMEHFIRSCREWLDLELGTKKRPVCDDICRTARERFVADDKRIKSHRGQGNTVLKARRLLC